jgi:glutamate-1-semialdehyde aminotransferase
VGPIQGKGVYMPDDHFLREAQRLCREDGTIFICDEVQTVWVVPGDGLPASVGTRNQTCCCSAYGA